MHIYIFNLYKAKNNTFLKIAMSTNTNIKRILNFFSLISKINFFN